MIATRSRSRRSLGTTAGLLFVIVVLAVVLAACGSGSGGSSSITPYPSKGDSNYAQLSQGRTVYVQNCARCHGVVGQGGAGVKLEHGAAKNIFPKIADHIAWVNTGGNGMPSFSGTLSKAQIAAVVAYERDVL
jgi:mono/diheme cytochrome c family protein